MQKKHFLTFSLIFLAFIIFNCSRDDMVNTPVSTTRGILVLCEGGFTPGSGDYAFINTVNDSVFNDVFKNSNNNANLGLFTDGMLLYGQSLYVTSQGSFGGPGRMFRIRTADNKLLDTVSFGVNPYDFELSQGYFWVTNIGGSTVTKIDGNLNVINPSISVGSKPTKIIPAMNYIYVAKASYTSENSIAIINVFNDNVTKVFFNAPPVSVAFNTGGVFVSAYTDKMIYKLDTLVFNNVVDSISMTSISNAAVGEIIAGNYRTLYAVGLDTSFYGNIGKAVYKVDIFDKSVSPVINDQSIADIFGIAYDAVNNQIVIADSKSGASPGQVRVYGADGTLRKTYQLTGYFPRKFAFKY
jgi:hypothetical protein